jgi:hypothetical protein
MRQDQRREALKLPLWLYIPVYPTEYPFSYVIFH